MTTRRTVLYVDQTMTDKDGNFVPAIVTEDEPGYTPATYHWGNDFAKASKTMDDVNATMGIDHATAMRIVGSSMAAQNSEA